MDDNCTNDSNKTDGLMVEIATDGKFYTNVSNFVEEVSIMTGIEEDKLKVWSELDEEEYVKRIIIMVSDESIAQNVAETINRNKCNDSTNILCRVKMVRILTKNLGLSCCNTLNDLQNHLLLLFIIV